MEISSMEAEGVQSRTGSASVFHRNGQNMSAAQTTAAAVPGSIASIFDRRVPILSPPLFITLLQYTTRGGQ